MQIKRNTRFAKHRESVGEPVGKFEVDLKAFYSAYIIHRRAYTIIKWEGGG